MATQDPMTAKTPEAGELPVRSGRVVRIIKYLVNNQRALGCMEKGDKTARHVCSMHAWRAFVYQGAYSES